LAYSQTCETLAVGLRDQVYGWSEAVGVRLLDGSAGDDAHLTSLAFSSTQGRKAILAFGRSNRKLGLVGITDGPEGVEGRILPRFSIDQPAPVACLSWKPTCTIRSSEAPYNSHPDLHVQTKDLLVGDDSGHVYYYSVEWPDRWEVERFNWLGKVRLRARIIVHTQQICGLSWSPDGRFFATGGNDNFCFLFQTSRITDAEANQQRLNQRLESQLTDPSPSDLINEGDARVRRSDLSVTERFPRRRLSTDDDLLAGEAGSVIRREHAAHVPNFREMDAKHKWTHGAAVKAIAFCPWQEGLVATGGGSNDKCIHFFHSTTGAALATISVSAQVTSLIWSTTQKEIVATFGYTQPEHSVRIAVFSWPDCRQVAAIPWGGHHRALYAIPYPTCRERGGSAARGSVISTRTATDGSIIVASSDGSVKFHEIWSTDRKRTTVGGARMLGGSDILDSLEGIDKEGDVIR
jgi:meiosis-specific APC/C activator protein AMA1